MQFDAHMKFDDGTNIVEMITLNHSMPTTLNHSIPTTLNHSMPNSKENEMSTNDIRPMRLDVDNKLYPKEEFDKKYGSKSENHWNNATLPNKERLKKRSENLEEIIRTASCKKHPTLGLIKEATKASYCFRHASTAELNQVNNSTNNLNQVNPSLVFYLEPNDVTPSQYWVTNPNGDYIENIKQTIMANPESLPPCAVIFKNKKAISLDNRRFIAYKALNVKIPCRIATPDEINNANEKLKDLNGTDQIPKIMATLTLTQLNPQQKRL